MASFASVLTVKPGLGKTPHLCAVCHCDFKRGNTKLTCTFCNEQVCARCSPRTEVNPVLKKAGRLCNRCFVGSIQALVMKTQPVKLETKQKKCLMLREVLRSEIEIYAIEEHHRLNLTEKLEKIRDKNRLAERNVVDKTETLKQSIAKTKRVIEEAQQKLGELSSKKQSKEWKIAVAQQEIEEVETLNETELRKNEQVRKLLGTKLAENQDFISDLKSIELDGGSNKGLREHLLEQRLLKQQAGFETITQTNSDLNQAISTLKTQRKTLHTEISEVRTELEHRGAAGQEYDALVKFLIDTINDQSTEIAELRQKVNSSHVLGNFPRDTTISHQKCQCTLY